VDLLREAGATEVHMRVSAPPFIAPCYFGTDIPDREKLIACHYSIEEITRLTGADSLGYLSLDALHRIAPDARCGFCDGCFTGQYPVSPEEAGD
jgi:amidophosphoribosyltransferase